MLASVRISGIPSFFHCTASHILFKGRFLDKTVFVKISCHKKNLLKKVCSEFLTTEYFALAESSKAVSYNSEVGIGMSGTEEETYSIMFSSLRHPARRKILRMLSERKMTFSQM
jgi:hypothetical protein